MNDSSPSRQPRHLGNPRATVNVPPVPVWWTWLGRLLLAGLIALAFLTLIRIVGLLLFRGMLADTAGDLASIGGADANLTDWMTGPFPLLASMLLFGLFARLLIGYFFPFLAGPKMVRDIVLAGVFTFLMSVAPTLLRNFLDTVRWQDLEEVDPAAERWFRHDGSARIFYADHLDGRRRYWNAPGSTPYDNAKALPVNEEVAREFQKEREREESEARRQQQLEEQRKAEDAAAAKKREHEESLAQLEKKLSDLRTLAEEKAASLEAADAPLLRAEVPAPAPVAEVPVHRAAVPATAHIPAAVPTPARKTPDHRFEVIPGRILELRLEHRLAEIWSDGAVEFVQTGSETVVVLGANSARTIPCVEAMRVRPVGKRSVTLHLRWLDANPDRRMPAVVYTGHEPASAPLAVATPPVEIPPPAPKVHRFALSVGRVQQVNIEGDTVDVWSDGPFFLTAGAGGTLREVHAGQRMRVSGAEYLVASPSAPEARVLNVQMVVPAPRKIAAEVAARANAGLR